MMSRLIAILCVASFLATEQANAQYAFGAGIYGGLYTSGCQPGGGGGYGMSAAAQSIKDDISDAEEEMKGLKDDLRDKKREMKEYERNARWIDTVLIPQMSSAVKDHVKFSRSPYDVMELKRSCSAQTSGESTLQQQETVSTYPWANYCNDVHGSGKNMQMVSIRANLNKWFATTGEVDPSVCLSDGGNASAVKSAYTKNENAKAKCKQGVLDYAKYISLQAEVSAYETQIQAQKDYIKDLKRDLKDQKRQDKRDMRDGYDVEMAEGNVCEDCGSSRGGGMSTWERIAMIGVGALAGYGSYKLGKYAVDQNAKLGWPSSPYVSSNILAPMAMAGIYGGLAGGIGAGGVGCSPYGMMNPAMAGMYGQFGGPFGYPGSMYGGPYGPFAGGGMFNPGYGPWGPSMYGGMYPGMGGGFGMGAGFGMGGYPGMGFPGMYPGMGAGGGIYGGLGMCMVPGCMPGGGIYGGMYPGMPGMGGMYPGMGGMYPGMGGMYPGMGGMYPGMGGMMNPQYSQQMLMQQQQQMQFMMQYQQQQQMKYQMVSRLQTELYQIQMQIQQITYGGGMYGGIYGGVGGGVGGVGGIPVDVKPLPGNVDPNLGGGGGGAIPGRGGR